MKIKISILLLFIVSYYSIAQEGFGIIKEFDNKKIETEYTSEIGMPIYTYGFVREIKTLEVIDINPKYGLRAASIGVRKGDLLLHKYDDNELMLFQANSIVNKGLSYNTKTKEYQPYSIKINLSGKKNLKIKPFKKGEYVKVKEAYEENDDCDICLKKELIYNGSNGEVASFSYREYIKNMARPAFQQNLTYDLNKDKVIGFKGLRIEVIETNNTSIKYKLLKKFASN